MLASHAVRRLAVVSLLTSLPLLAACGNDDHPQPRPTATATQVPTFNATATSTPTSTASPTGTPTATATLTPSSAATATSTATVTPTATATMPVVADEWPVLNHDHENSRTNAAETRLARDNGINDIGLGNPDVTADQIIAGYRELIDRGHAHGLTIIGGTLTPAAHNAYPFYEPYDEAKRLAVNQFIRESGAFDGTVDFDRAVDDPADASRWKAGFSADQLHPSDAGAEVLADAIDLTLFQ